MPYAAARMFELVNDIESYPQFLPWCRSTTVHSRSEDEVRATIEMAKGGLQKSFTTINRLQRNKMVEVRLLQGPFRRLDGFWLFDSLREDASKITLDLEFEIAGTIASRLMGPVFNEIANSLVDAFCGRAKDLYG